MPVTLAQAQVNTANDVDYNVIDTFRRNSWIMDNIVFDDVAVPGTGGATLGHTYTRKLTGAAAAPRAINSEYIPGKATRQQYSVTLKPMGGSFEIDRVLANIGPAATNEITFQMLELNIAVRERFVREMLYGDTAVDANGFDGLSKALVGASTETTTATNWTPAIIDTQAEALAELDKIDAWLAKIVPSAVGGMTPGMSGELPAGVKALIMNTTALVRFRALARWAGLYSVSQDNMGRQAEVYRDWRLVDAGDRADGATPVVPTTGGVTEIFAATFGLDAVHAVSAAGKPLVQSWLPDFTTAGAVKVGEVELGPAAFVLKNSRAAGVYRNITVGSL